MTERRNEIEITSEVLSGTVKVRIRPTLDVHDHVSADNALLVGNLQRGPTVLRTKGTGEGRRSGRWSRAGAETLGAVFRGVRQGGCEGSHQGAFLSAFRSIGEEGARGSRALRDVSRACSCDRTPLQSE